MFNPLHDISGSKVMNSKINKKFLNERTLGYKRSTPQNSATPTSNYTKFFKVSGNKKKKRPKSSISYSKSGNFGQSNNKREGLSTKDTRLPSGKTRKSRPLSSRSLNKAIDNETINLRNSYADRKINQFFF